MERKVTCPVCRAKLEYTEDDVETGYGLSAYRYIICPDCDSEIRL